MPGIYGARKVQISQMPLNGTTDIATTVWRGTGMIDDLSEPQFPDEFVGVIGGVNRSYITKTGSEFPFDGVATFEQLPYLFDAGIHTATPTTDSGSGYIYTYNLQWSSTDLIASTDITPMVIEAGDNQQAEITRSVFVRELKLAGSQGEALMTDGTVGEGQTVSTTTFTTGLSIPTVEDILFSKSYLYIDPSSDTIGTTQVSNTLLSMELNLGGWQAIMVGDGNTYFSSVKFAPTDPMTLSITFEHDSNSVSEKANWLTGAERGIRLLFNGSALSSAGTYTYKTLQIDLYGVWSNFEPLDESDGNDTVTGEFRIGYSTSAAAKGQIIVVNEVSALP